MNFNSAYKNAYATMFVNVKIFIIISSDVRGNQTQLWDSITVDGLDSIPGVNFAPGEGMFAFLFVFSKSTNIYISINDNNVVCA